MLKILVAAVSMIASSAAVAALPPAFTDVTLEEAKKQVAGTEKMLLIKFTAEWCMPCKAMDKTTWQDAKVVEWVKAHGVAIEVDVDKEKKIAGEFQIAAMPTMVMIKGGNEIARKVGYMDGPKTLAWMEDVSSGKLADGPKVNKDSKNMQERLMTARELSQAGKAAEATEEYVWLWDNMVQIDPSMSGVRGSFMASDMAALASRNEGAKAAFTKLRDAAEAKMKTEDRDFRTLDDWMVLNGVIGDEARTLAWFDRVKGEKDGVAAFAREAFRLQDLLIENQRFADLMLLYPDPAAAVQSSYMMASQMASMDRKLPEGLDEATKAEIKEQPWTMFREQVAALYLGALAAGKDDVAAAVMAKAIELRDSPRTITGPLGFALRNGQARPAMKELLDTAEKNGGDVKDLRASLEKALAEKK